MVTVLPGTWEDTFTSWAKPASDSEDDKKDRAVALITDAIRRDPSLPSSVAVYAKGSYANSTNVRRDSDVDVAAEWTDTYFYDRIHGAEHLTPEQLGIVPATSPMTPGEFKERVQRALEAVFGAGAVTRHNRCLTVRETRRSLAADVVPCFTYKAFVGNPPETRTGIAIHPDSGGRTENWPRQNYDNGVLKNDATGRRYKKMVRILKRLENELVDKSLSKPVRSYLVECLVYNVSNPTFNHRTLTEDVFGSLLWIYKATLTDEEADDLLEVNEIKYLFRPTQRWNRGQANDFAIAALAYLGA